MGEAECAGVLKGTIVPVEKGECAHREYGGNGDAKNGREVGVRDKR